MVCSFDEILAWFSGPAELSRALNIPYQSANSMLRRKSIHARNWERLIKAAADKGETLSAEQLVALARRKTKAPGGEPRA